MGNKWVGITYLTILSEFYIIITSQQEEDANSVKPQVEVRAVFINCQPEVLNVAPECEMTRFEREEIFKHNVLKDCNKKLAVTVKIASAAGNSGEEYLPIEHVFESSNEKRVRLLDPYILRIQRDKPREAYKLRRLETVSGVLMNVAEQTSDHNIFKTSRDRIQRDVQKAELEYPTSQMCSDQQDSRRNQIISQKTVFGLQELDESRENEYACPTLKKALHKRYKRNEHNIVVETVTEHNMDYLERQSYQAPNQDKKQRLNDYGGKINRAHYKTKPKYKKESTKVKPDKYTILKNPLVNIAGGSRYNVKTIDPTQEGSKVNEEDIKEQPTLPYQITDVSKNHSTLVKDKAKIDHVKEPKIESQSKIGKNGNKGASNKKNKEKRKYYTGHALYSQERDYAVYEIGSPELWHTVQVQLFEKMSTPEGKTVWNDLTKGDVASVGLVTPEWSASDLNVRYRLNKWTVREEYTLPSLSRLCLLTPINNGHITCSDDSATYYSYQDADFIVVPKDDILGLTDDDGKQNGNSSQSDGPVNSSDIVEQNRRKVVIRVARALLKGNEEKLGIASRGNDKYLTLHHRQPLHAQIDLEARADENELVRVGSSGRISIAVADSTRRTRTILHLQVGNTGLAAARFRVAARDCYPILSDSTKSKEAMSVGPILIPPRHTRSFRLEIPVEIPAEIAHCSVTLINEDGQSVAVRDVAIKKSDRCFCVWHCDCVCLSTDPKLMCRDMDEARQKAAGLSVRDRVRHARSIYCYDIVTVNIAVVFAGALVILLIMGLAKAILGLMCSCIGTWGLRQVLQSPRRLDHYYERSLRLRTVEYDKEGWPIHPDTKTNDVHLVSRPVEFILNTIFFIIVPCLTIYEALKQLYSRSSSKSGNSRLSKDITKEVFSSHDMQEMVPRWRRHRDGLRRWMTPQAQELSTELWQKSLNVRSADKDDFLKPLLPNNRTRVTDNTPDSCPDSEQEDTDYVLTQMQKSRESLARSQKKTIDSIDVAPQALQPSASNKEELVKKS